MVISLGRSAEQAFRAVLSSATGTDRRRRQGSSRAGAVPNWAANTLTRVPPPRCVELSYPAPRCVAGRGIHWRGRQRPRLARCRVAGRVARRGVAYPGTAGSGSSGWRRWNIDSPICRHFSVLTRTLPERSIYRCLQRSSRWCAMVSTWRRSRPIVRFSVGASSDATWAVWRIEKS
jgi:hypothetical protein